MGAYLGVIDLPLIRRWRRPIRGVKQIVVVPAFLGAKIPGIEASAPAMPGRFVRNSLNLFTAFRTEEMKSIIRDIFRTSKQTRRGNIL